MNNNPTPFTDADYKELAASPIIQGVFADATDTDTEELLRDMYCVKFENYITDGPGYAGPVWVILTGVLTPIVVTRTNGEFVLEDN